MMREAQGRRTSGGLRQPGQEEKTTVKTGQEQRIKAGDSVLGSRRLSVSLFYLILKTICRVGRPLLYLKAEASRKLLTSPQSTAPTTE